MYIHVPIFKFLNKNKNKNKNKNTKHFHEIARTPVTNDGEFEAKLKSVQEKVDILLNDAKYEASGSGKIYVEVLNDLHKNKNDLHDQHKEI
ncbi:hypothetical protein DOY81_001252 [Sarcophaga bullata]|nr:hypothetical protein DOY81_001252 [Sarcophaga bullata]